MKLHVKKFAALTGVTVRTLHYYDEIDLLKPDCVDEQNGYRYYGDTAFCRMQEILFYKELDFSLDDIRDILASPHHNRQEALQKQKQLLLLKKARLEKIIDAIAQAEKGEPMEMNASDNHDYETAKDIYRDEVKQRWGETAAYKEHQKKTAGYKKRIGTRLVRGSTPSFRRLRQQRLPVP